MQQSSNPALSNKAFSRFATGAQADKMTIGGTLGKVGLAFVVLLVAAGWGWTLLPQFGTTIPVWALWAGIAVTFVVGLIAAFKANFFTVMLYAALEGTYLGIISRLFETAYDGIITQAILLTGAIALAAYVLYAARIVKVTKRFASIVMIATIGVLFYLIAELILSLFVPGFANIVFSGVGGIIIAAIIALIAALNLFLDFNTIETGAEKGLDKKAEWYAAFGLVVTLIWLYLSILRLLAASRR